MGIERGWTAAFITTLRISERFEKVHLSSFAVALLIDNTKFFYVKRYSLTHGVESALYLSSKVPAAGQALMHAPVQTFVLNISALSFAPFFSLCQILLCTDVVIANEPKVEAEALANGLPDIMNHDVITEVIAHLPKVNAARLRTVALPDRAESTSGWRPHVPPRKASARLKQG